MGYSPSAFIRGFTDISAATCYCACEHFLLIVLVSSRIKHFVKNTLVGPLLAVRCLGIPCCDHWVFRQWRSDHSFLLLFVL